MPYSDRFSEPLPATPARAAPRINSLAKLRTELGASDLPEPQQRALVAGWLRKNRPNDALVWSIKRRGWGDLLPAAVA